MPKPRKKNQKMMGATSDMDDDLPGPPPKQMIRPAVTNKEEDDLEEGPPPRKEAKKNKGKDKEGQLFATDNNGKANPDRPHDPNVPKPNM